MRRCRAHLQSSHLAPAQLGTQAPCQDLCCFYHSRHASGLTADPVGCSDQATAAIHQESNLNMGISGDFVKPAQGILNCFNLSNRSIADFSLSIPRTGLPSYEFTVKELLHYASQQIALLEIE